MLYDDGLSDNLKKNTVPPEPGKKMTKTSKNPEKF